jgi:ATP-dependent DNA helicase RecG
MAFTPLDQSAQFLKSVGPRRAEALARLDVHTARDLLFHVPRRYEDASTVTRIGDLQIGEDATVIGEVVAKGVVPTRSGLRVFQLSLRDSTARIDCSFPGQPFLDRAFRNGDIVLVTGPVRFFHGKQIQPREWVILGSGEDGVQATGKVLPIYGATEGLSQKVLRSIIDQNIDRLLPLIQVEDAVPRELIAALSLPTLMQALAAVHRPESLRDAERGRRRLAFDELLFLQLLHASARRQHATERCEACTRTDALIAPLYRALPFELTAARRAPSREIVADMASPAPHAPAAAGRRRSGEDGRGAVRDAARRGERLPGRADGAHRDSRRAAHTHARASCSSRSASRRVLLTGRLAGGEARGARGDRSGAARLVVGTHALIQDAVSFDRSRAGHRGRAASLRREAAARARRARREAWTCCSCRPRRSRARWRSRCTAISM